MPKKIIILILATVTIGVIFFTAKNNNNFNETKKVSDKTENIKDESIPVNQISADKIEVIHFHGTHQCWSCITVGEYALKTIRQKFLKEYNSEKIVFKDINGELPENKDIVTKYQARGSSLFVNSITNGKDRIEEDVNVWRLVNNEDQFINYFENKLNKLLGR